MTIEYVRVESAVSVSVADRVATAWVFSATLAVEPVTHTGV